jgi:tetratricopeptide (TPR) repeat protein
MFCTNCGNKLPDGSNFCSSCGTKVGNTTEVKQTTSADSVPQAATVYFEQGIEYLAQKDSINAANAFNAAIRIAPNYYEAKKELVKIYSSGENNKIAIDLIEKMIKDKPDDVETFYLRAELYIKSGQLDQALMDLTIAKKINPDLPEIYGLFGKIYTIKKENKKAIENYSEAIKLSPKEAKYYTGRGNGYFSENLFENAIEDYSSVLSLSKDNVEALYGRGLSLFKLNKYDDALVDIDKLLSINQDNLNYLDIHAKICFLKKDYKKAAPSFAYFISIMDKSEEYHSLEPFEYHAKSCLELKKFSDVREDYIRILEINPDYQFQDSSCFIDGLAGYYEEELVKYKSDKKTFLLIGRKGCYHQKEGEFVNIKGGVFDEKRLLTSFPKNPPIVFFCEKHARDYGNTLWTYWLRKNNYPFRKSDFYYRKEIERDRYRVPERIDQYQITQNKSNEDPSFWFILHMPSGKIFNNNEGKIKFERTTDNGFPSDDNNTRFNTIEETIKKYKELIKLLFDKKAQGNSSHKIISDLGLYVGYEADNYGLRCDDFFIAGTYNMEKLSNMRIN